jgi:lipopolysaccharide transport system permease protein
MSSHARHLNIVRSQVPQGQDPRYRRLVYYFDLMRHLIWRDFSLRYKRSVLGIVWSLVLPLAQLLVLVFLFQSVVPLNIESYPVFVFTALLPWSWFSSSISSACGLFMGNRDLLRRPDFAPLLLMLVNTLSNLLSYIIALSLLIPMLLFYNITLTPALAMLPVLLAIQSLLIIGLSMIVATLNVFYRDVQHIVGVVLTLLFYLTPVFYRSQSVAEGYHMLYILSPISVLIQAYRAIFFYGVMPAWSGLVFATMSGLFLCVVGLLIYGWRQHEIVDLI